jgi:hypothetical protein
MKQTTTKEVLQNIVESTKIDSPPLLAYKHSNGKLNDACILFESEEAMNAAGDVIQPVVEKWIRQEKVLGIGYGMIVGSIVTGGLLIGGFYLKRKYDKRKSKVKDI